MERIAATMLRIRDDEPVTWIMATVPEEDLTTLPEGRIFGYGVDSGYGCFTDLEAARFLAAEPDEGDEPADAEAAEDFQTELDEQMQRTYQHVRSWADVIVKPSIGATLIGFTTGLGDGGYASYFGFSQDGTVTCLVTDFALLHGVA